MYRSLKFLYGVSVKCLSSVTYLHERENASLADGGMAAARPKMGLPSLVLGYP
jgi:hypothetical protein